MIKLICKSCEIIADFLITYFNLNINLIKCSMYKELIFEIKSIFIDKSNYDLLYQISSTINKENENNFNNNLIIYKLALPYDLNLSPYFSQDNILKKILFEMLNKLSVFKSYEDNNNNTIEKFLNKFNLNFNFQKLNTDDVDLKNSLIKENKFYKKLIKRSRYKSINGFTVNRDRIIQNVIDIKNKYVLNLDHNTIFKSYDSNIFDLNKNYFEKLIKEKIDKVKLFNYKKKLIIEKNLQINNETNSSYYNNFNYYLKTIKKSRNIYSKLLDDKYCQNYLNYIKIIKNLVKVISINIKNKAILYSLIIEKINFKKFGIVNCFKNNQDYILEKLNKSNNFTNIKKTNNLNNKHESINIKRNPKHINSQKLLKFNKIAENFIEFKSFAK